MSLKAHAKNACSCVACGPLVPGFKNVGSIDPRAEFTLGGSARTSPTATRSAVGGLRIQKSSQNLCAAHGHLTEQVCASTNYVGQCMNGLKCASDALAT